MVAEVFLNIADGVVTEVKDTCGEDGVCAFDARVWREVAHFAGLAPLTALAFHGESKLFVGDTDGRLYALDVWKAPPRSWE